MGSLEDFRAWVQSLMDLNHWNQSDLARESGVSKDSVSRIFIGAAIGYKVCNGLAKAFKVSPYEVYVHAGLITAEKDRTPIRDEIDHKVGLISAENQKIVLDLLNGILDREEREKINQLHGRPMP